MTIKPTYLKTKEELKADAERLKGKIPEPMMVPIRKFNEYDIEIVGQMMSNIKLGIYKYPMFATHPLYFGIAFVSEFDQYVIILTSENKGGWEAENVADLVTDEKALELITKLGREQLLDEPEFSRLKKLKNDIDCEELQYCKLLRYCEKINELEKRKESEKHGA